MRKVLIGVGILILVMMLITLALYIISREPAVENQVVQVEGPNPTEEYQKYINDTNVTKIYLGTLPCDDCDGVETVLSLTKENEEAVGGKFVLVRSFLGTSEPAQEVEGTWSVESDTEDEAGLNVYVISSNDGVEERYGQVDSGNLVKLDESGNQIQDVENYTLVLQ